jgi:transposase
MDDALLTTVLDTGTGVGPEPARRVEVLSGMAGRRRSWSLEQKLAIVAEAQGCDNLAAFARRHDIRTSLLYTWRRELRYAAEAAGSSRARAERSFVPVLADVGARSNREPIDASIEVEIGDAVVRISRAAEIKLVTAVVQALRR